MTGATAAILAGAAVTAATVLYADGGVNGFSLWNLTPIFPALIILLVDKSIAEIRYAVFGFSCTVISATFLVHVGYALDIGERVGALSFLDDRLYGLPLYSVAAGYVSGMICLAVVSLRGRGGERTVGREGQASKEENS